MPSTAVPDASQSEPSASQEAPIGAREQSGAPPSSGASASLSPRCSPPSPPAPPSPALLSGGGAAPPSPIQLSSGDAFPERLPQEPVGAMSAPKWSTQEPANAATAPEQEPTFAEEVIEEIPCKLPRLG